MGRIMLRMTASKSDRTYTTYAVTYLSPELADLLRIHTRLENRNIPIFTDDSGWYLGAEAGFKVSTGLKQLALHPYSQGAIATGYTTSRMGISRLVFNLNRKYYSNSDLKMEDVWTEDFNLGGRA